AVLLRHCQQIPCASSPDLGFRRMQPSVYPKKTTSTHLAERVGFKHEGLLR
ncbi:uncharacterized protein LAESUDRAFT_640850, partial [Laetiporus sulphureus 93-53]